MQANPNGLSILLIEDNPGDAKLIRMAIESQGEALTLEHSSSLADGLRRLDVSTYNLVLLDLGLPDAQGLEGMRELHMRWPTLPIVILSGSDNKALATEAVKEGAQDYIVKGGATGDRILRAAHYANERQLTENRRADLVAAVASEVRSQVHVLVGALDLYLGRPDDEGRSLLRAARASASTLEDLTQAMLQLAKSHRVESRLLLQEKGTSEVVDQYKLSMAQGFSALRGAAVAADGYGEAAGFREDGTLASLGVRALVLADQEDGRHIVGRTLRRAGVHVIEARDGESGIDSLEHKQLDLVVLDIYVMELVGWRAVQKINETAHQKGIPVLWLRGAQPESSGPGLVVDQGPKVPGNVRILTKPVTPSELVQQARAALTEAQAS